MTAVNEGTRGDKRKANAERNLPAAVCTVCGNHAPVEAVVAAARGDLVERLEALADEWEHPAEVYALRKSAAPRLRAALGDPR